MGNGKPRQLLEVLQLAAGYLAGHGVENPRLDAEVTLAEALGIDRIQLYVQFDRVLTEEELSRYRDATAKRAARVPVAYITGHKEFMSLEFGVDPRVLIPRPDTEILVEAAGKRLAGIAAARGPEGADVRVVDIGVGSGAIACALARLVPGARILGVDISPDAVEVASANVERLGLGDRIALTVGDICEPLRKAGVDQAWSEVTAVVSNPPYIPSADIPNLAPEIAKYEPRVALDGGADGLELYRRIALEARDFIEPGGFIALEVGDGQASTVANILVSAGFSCPELYPDYTGADRVVMATRDSIAGNAPCCPNQPRKEDGSDE